MADQTSNLNSIGVIEGYHVFSNEGDTDVKQEPVDPDFEDSSRQINQDETHKDEGNVRMLLKKMLEDKSKKQLTVKNVMESLLLENQELLAKNDPQALKPQPQFEKPKQKSETSTKTQNSIPAPKDPTPGCSGDDIPNVDDGLVEIAVSESKETNCDPDLVCAVGSKIILMTPQGESLDMDITCYWCNFCNFNSKNKEVLLQHVMKHRFHCKYCKFQSFSRAAVIHHCLDEHESFSETAVTLKYCTYLPDLLQRKELLKRKRSSSDGDAPSAKKPCTGDPEDIAKMTEEQEQGLPVISSVISGQKAVSAAMTTSSLPAPPPAPKATTGTSTKPGVTVSSGLCWNCGYCGFVTLSQAFLKVHLNAQHQGKAHKYVAMLISSSEEMAKIKASDAQLATNPAGAAVVTVNPVQSELSTPRTTVTRIEIDNAENHMPANKIVEEKVDEKRIPVSFKCAHCNFNASQEERVKSHLFQKHSGCVIYALDMKAVKLRQKRYIFFCLGNECTFQTKETEDYLEHIEKCTPWLAEDNDCDVDPALVKSLRMTKNFIEKTVSGVGFGRDTRQGKTAEYACIHCSYTSNNNTRLKKHVIMNHSERAMIIKDVLATKGNRPSAVYFCKICLWETRSGSNLEIHLTERHNEDGSDTQLSSTEVDSDSQSSTAFSDKQTPPSEDNHARGSDAANNSLSAVTDNEYEGIISADLYEKALAAYVESEYPEPKQKTRPTRNAAVKCRLRNKAESTPPLYQCIHCTEIFFGTRLMRSHIREKHENKPLRAIDILKKERKSRTIYTYFCPTDKCVVAEAFATDIINHAKNKHGLDSVHPDLVCMTNARPERQVTVLSGTRTGRLSTPATGESYECLYCTESNSYHSRKDMKKHLIDEHDGEEFIFRDCVARKLKQSSRFYMCHNQECDFTTERQKDYLLHMLGHQKAKIYECSKCQWFTSVAHEIDNHLIAIHSEDRTGITTLEIDLDLDSNGGIIKRVGGTVIKTERD